MKKLFSLFILAISIILCPSCEKEIDFRGQTPPGQIYANCIFNPDSIFRVYISYSQALTSPASEIDQKIEEAKDALVLIKDYSGMVIDTLELVAHYNDLAIQYLVFESYDGLRPLAGELYQLSISEPLYERRKDFFGVQEVPEQIPGTVSVVASSPFISTANVDEAFNFIIDWEDPSPNEQNYFIIETVFRYTDHILNEVEQTRSEFYIIGEEGDNQDIGKETDKYLYIFVDDDKMPAPLNPPFIETAIAVPTSNWDNWIGKNDPNYSCDLAVRIRHVTEETYRYYKEVEAYRRSTGSDIFAQPVEVHSNVDKGIGFVGAETLKEFVYQIQ